MMPGRYVRRAACGLAFFMCAATQALAGSFEVGPVSATLSTDRPVAALTVRNTGTDPAVIQLEVVSWSQAEGKDTYAPAGDVLATPPIFTIAAGASQVIRIGSRAPDTQVERAYRLFLHEVPPPPKPGFQGMRMALEISLPVFVVPATPIAPSLQWQATVADGGHLRLRLSNTGSAHVRVTRFSLTSTSKKTPLPMSMKAVYVLSGTSHEWLVDAAVASGDNLHFTAQTESGIIQADLVVATR
jgi:fimbrial chaperone protein